MTDYEAQDRALAAEELDRARRDGRITQREYDQRLRAATSVTTYAELAALTADLPHAAPPPAKKRRSGRVRTVLFTIVFGINFLVWGIVSLSLHTVLHPWWVWVGLGLGVLALIAP